MNRVWTVAVDSARFVTRLPRHAVVLVLRLYRMVVSPIYGDVCRFYPSCAQYALEAGERHGAIRGGWVAVRRLLRCHPWNPGGVDHVPPARGVRPHRHSSDPHSRVA